MGLQKQCSQGGRRGSELAPTSVWSARQEEGKTVSSVSPFVPRETSITRPAPSLHTLKSVSSPPSLNGPGAFQAVASVLGLQASATVCRPLQSGALLLSQVSPLSCRARRDKATVPGAGPQRWGCPVLRMKNACVCDVPAVGRSPHKARGFQPDSVSASLTL